MRIPERCVLNHTLISVCLLTAVLLVLPGDLRHSLWAQEGYTGREGYLDDLFILKGTKTSRISSYDRSGGNHDWVDIAPGETKVLAEIPGAGVIRRFYVAPYAPDRMRYRKLILRMYWDGEKDPCVEVPIGDFFGSGLGTLRYFRSLVVNINPGFRGWDFDGLVNYFPMPFEKGARITLENDGKVADFRLWYHIDYEQFSGAVLPGAVGRFHAQWRRVARTPVRAGVPKNTTLGNNAAKNTTGEDNYVILDAEGQGSYVGLFLTVDNVAGEWYGEGDDMIFVDGAKWPPTYPGTGHEEIFNSGCCPDSEFWGPYTGFYLIENLNGNFGGKNQMYRFYVNDPVRFQKSIRVTVEHGHANNFENDYTSTAFWYQKDPHKAFPSMPSAQERLPGWPADVAEALEREAKLSEELAAMRKEGKFSLTPQDEKLLLAIVADSNKAFRELRYQDYIRCVLAEESLVRRYKAANP
jgi:hypothetical protein